MTDLRIPELLEGPWQHALFLTYGVDIPFFENAILRQLGPSCRNKLILADGNRFLDSCSRYSQPGIVRHLNRLYVADGILIPHSAHAKLILLANETKGRLLVGSGNLGMAGYASAGEMFSQYEYQPDAEECLNAFLAVREFVQGLFDQAWIGQPARRRFQHLLENTPWLFNMPIRVDQPVRHNLQQSFLTQIQEVIGEEEVEELVVLSPFYDAEAVALRTLLQSLRPRHTTLFVQPGQTSLNGAAVDQVINTYGKRVDIYPFQRDERKLYVHAKLYLMKTAKRAICLQGSPNLSQVAMLRTPPHGNIELANLLVGERDQFDYLLVDFQRGAKIDQLQTAGFQLEESEERPITTASFYLTRGEFQDTRLILQYHGILPSLDTIRLVIGDDEFPLNLQISHPDTLELLLTQQELVLLERSIPLCIGWRTGENLQLSNPIFVCHLAKLQRELEVSDSESRLGQMGALDLEDAEFERLLAELDETLVIDRRSVWQLVGRANNTASVDDEDGALLSYDEIDYEGLRRHPRIQQYLVQRSGGSFYMQSRMQRILTSIGEHIEVLLNPKSTLPSTANTLVLNNASSAEVAEEAEQEEVENSQRQVAAQQRIKRVLQHFCRRYLRGIAATDFQEFAGSTVMTQNYHIFLHILWRLLGKEWLEYSFVIECFVQIGQVFWGNTEARGYFAKLADEERNEAMAFLEENHWHGRILSAFYYASRWLHAASKEYQPLRTQLRVHWLRLLVDSPLCINDKTLKDAWHFVADLYAYDPPRPTNIAATLTELANEIKQEEFLRMLEDELKVARHSCKCKRVQVYRAALNREDTVTCLYLGKGVELNKLHMAKLLIRQWMRFDPKLNYYRIHTIDEQQLIYYDCRNQQGIYWDKTSSTDEVEFSNLSPLSMAWDEHLEEMTLYAVLLDEELAVKIGTYSPLVAANHSTQVHAP